MSDVQERKVIVSRAILSYPKLFEPEPGPNGGEAKYGCTLVIEDKATIQALTKVAVAAAQEKWGEKATKLIRAGKLKMPIIKTTEEDPGYPEGSVYIRPRSKNKPGIVSIYPDPENPKKPAKITDEDEVYPGIIVKASVVAFTYDVNGNKGVSFALNNIQKLADGERLDSRVKAEDEFAVDEDAVANLEDMESDADAANEDEDDEDDEAEPVKAPSKKAAKKAAKKQDVDDDEGDDLSDLYS
ncbi:MAG: ssDNA-binding protein [Nitrospiraceae bacterium]